MVEVYYPDLLDLCINSTEVNAFCDDYLHQLKANRDFGAKQLVYKDNWTDEYRYLFNEQLATREIVEGYVQSDEYLQARSIANLRKVAKKFDVKQPDSKRIKSWQNF